MGLLLLGNCPLLLQPEAKKRKEMREMCITLKTLILQTSNIQVELDNTERTWPGITNELHPSKALDMAIKESINKQKQACTMALR